MANEVHDITSNAMRLYTQDSIQSRILTIRGQQIMMDADLAELYQVKTIALNQAVKRNEARFPERYRFQLTETEKCQLITKCDRFSKLKHSTYLPYAFTESGVTQLSAVLRSDVAVEMSIRINDAFHAMRKFIINNAGVFQRLEAVELKQIATDEKIDRILNRLDDGSLTQKLGIFFDGQMFDAFVLVEELIQKATKRFDNYNTQYPTEKTNLYTFNDSHDRWLIIDDVVYHFGASIKDLGKRWFSVDVITEHTADELISKLK